MPGGGARCVNVSSGHGSKGHQLKNGKVLAVGKYVSRISFPTHKNEFRSGVYILLDQLLRSLHKQVLDGQESEAQAAAEIHQSTVMVPLYEHAARGQADAFISHSICLSCLFEPPEHTLPCGHILCTPCLKAYGHPRGKTLVEIRGCPIEPAASRRRFVPWRIFLKPAAAGVRILTLDGCVTLNMYNITRLNRALTMYLVVVFAG